MGEPAYKDFDVDHSVSDEAVRSVEQARVREIEFLIQRQIAPQKLEHDDMRSLARAILGALDEKAEFERADIAQRLIRLGRTSHKADYLANLVFERG